MTPIPRRHGPVIALLRQRGLQGLALIVAASLLTGGLARGGECLQWIKRTNVGSYGQRMRHAMAYDSDRGVTVFFGGEIGKPTDTTYFNDTQEYDGRQWNPISTAVKPPVRSRHAMVYDPVRKKIVLFGGGRTAPATRYTDTWLYTSDGVNGFWELQPQAIIPHIGALVGGEGMIWDPVAAVALLHNLDTWSWDGTAWTFLFRGPDVADYGFAFDADRSTAMIVGGLIFTGSAFSHTADVWEKRPGMGWEFRGPGPSTRAELAMSYDERRKRTVMVGGVGESVETGETAYEHIAGTGWITLPSLPSGQGRAGAKMVYDSKRGVMVLTGGAGGGAPNAANGGRYSDTWELWPSLFVSGQPSDATNLVCTTATFSVFVQGASPFQYRWRLDGMPLSDDAHFSGSQTTELQINGLRQAHAGKYDVVVRDSCVPQNVVTSKVATLTIQPGAQWILRATNGPPPRFGHVMAYDSTRRVTVLFGGRTNWNGLYPFNDLWEWDGARWTQRVENSVSNGWVFVPQVGWRVAHTNQPVRRAHFAMAYDSRRGRVVMFGGRAMTPDNSVVNLKDLWEWDGMRWHFRASNGPVARFNCSMAFDEQRGGRTVLFGGQPVPVTGEQPDGELVWEWDGERWHTNQPSLNPGSANYRAGARMIYDSFRRVIVFGPNVEDNGYSAFWDWDGFNWSNSISALSDPVLLTLSGTHSSGWAFDANRRRGILFGGYQGNPHNKTALFDGKQWTLLTDSPTNPAPRGDVAMTYDSRRGVAVMFGGSLTGGGATGATNDTWELIAMDVPLINEQPASQYRVAGETATFSVSAVSPSFRTYQWYHGDTPIPGATASTFTIPSVQPEDAGDYSVLVSNPCGATRSHPAILTLNPSLQIFFSANTMTLIWKPDPAVVMEAADNVAGPWTTVSDPPNPFPIGGGPAKFFRHRRTE